jgi:hypothetical protein
MVKWFRATVHLMATKFKTVKVLAAQSSTPDEPMVPRLKRRMICVNGHVRWKATASSTG